MSASSETPGRLMTGAEYIESLRDGRQVFIGGQRVPDVTVHPAFRNAVRSIARLYDALHDAAFRDVLTARDRQGTLAHKFFKPSYSAAELREAGEAIAAWARFSYGFMGRTPDYKASFMATLGAAHEVEDVYLHVVKETDAGIYVTGAKMLATGSAIGQDPEAACRELERGAPEEIRAAAGRRSRAGHTSGGREQA